MKNSQKKLILLRKNVDKKLVKEGFFDDIKNSFNRAKQKQTDDVAAYRQKRLEMDRLTYIKKGRPVPSHLSKASLRAYYTNPNSIPDFLQGGENDPLPQKQYTSGRKATDIEDRVKEKSANFIGNALGLHPSAQENLEDAMKVASITGIAGAAATAYNWYKNTFGAEKAKEALPDIEAAAESSAKNEKTTSIPKSNPKPEINHAPEIKSLDSAINILAGIPANKEMKYIYISDVAEYFDKVYPSRKGEDIDESKIKTMIDGPVGDLIFGKARNKINSQFKKSIKWSSIYNNVKNDPNSDKKGLGYLSGHYYIGNNKSGGRNKYVLVPLGNLAYHFPNFDINDLI